MPPYKRSKRAPPSNRVTTLAGEGDRDKGLSGALGGSAVGSCAAGNRHTAICTPNQQLQGSQLQRALPAQPPVAEWERELQGYPDAYWLPRPTCSPQWPPDRDGAGRLESSTHGAPFQRLQDIHLPIHPPPSHTQSTDFGYMMSDELQYDLPEPSRYQFHAGSDDSQTLRGSYNASQDGTLDPSFDSPGGLTYSYSSKAAIGCVPVDEEVAFPPPRFTANYFQTSGSISQDGQYPVSRQILEWDMPWSPLNPFHEDSPSLTRQPRMPHLPGETLDCHDDGCISKHLTSIDPYPPQISSPLTDAAWPMNEASLMIYESHLHETLPDHSEVSYVDNNMVYSDHTRSDLPAQSQRERARSPNRYPQFSDQSYPPDRPWPPVDKPRTMHVMPKNQPSTHQTMLRNNSYADEASPAFDDIPTSAQSTPSKKKHQATRKTGISALNTSLNPKWQNSIVSRGTFQELNPPEGIKKKGARRIGPLPAESKRKAKEIRKMHACWRCWLLHQSCSLDLVCSRCQTSFSLSSHICIRANLPDYADLLFPALLVDRRRPSAVKLQMDENLTGFTNNQIKVSVSSGPSYTPIVLLVYEFLTRPDRANELLSCFYAPSNIHSPKPALERVYTPPLGIKDGVNDTDLRESCQEHVRGLIKSSRFSKEATDGDASLISQKVYMVINRYRNSGQTSKNADRLLRKAMKLHAMHFFMSRVITFTKESAKGVVKNLRQPMQRPYGRRVSSKLLDNQIKQVMNLLQLALTREVLEDLQKELRGKSRDLWGPCFCVILLLSMCIEAVQIAADGFIVQTMIEKNGTSVLSRDSTIEIVQPLDDRLFRDCVHIFHLIHRSGESISENGFNPIRDGITINPTHGIGGDTVQLVEGIRQIIEYHQVELEEKAKNPSWECEGDLLASHYRLRQQNSGRLVAKFLKSFLEVS